MEHYRIITIDITQIDEEQEEMLNDIPGMISKRSITLDSHSTVRLAEKADIAIIGVKNDILQYEREVEDIKLDHVKGDMQ